MKIFRWSGYQTNAVPRPKLIENVDQKRMGARGIPRDPVFGGDVARMLPVNSLFPLLIGLRHGFVLLL